MSELNFQYNFPLKTFNTFNLQSNAEAFCQVATVEQMQQAIEFSRSHNKSIQVLGGGSNVLLPKNIAGLIVHPVNQGVDLIENGRSPLVRVAAGENWHNLVEKTLAQGWYGLENLALIPGNMGAAPIQNIGAYGVELNDVFHSLEAMHLLTGELVTLSKSDCQFGYRDSVFKHALAGQFIITSVTLQLQTMPNSNMQYPALKQALKDYAPVDITPLLVANTVADIRRSKLPDPAKMANAGSFFKNPIVTLARAKRIREKHPALVSYSATPGHEKLAAGWLLEQAGWKGWQQENLAVHNQQALVLVNKGNACLEEVLSFAKMIQNDIATKFDVQLEIEPQRLSAG